MLSNRLALGLILVVPVVQLLLFGYAIKPSATQITVAIAAENPGQAQAVAAELMEHDGISIVRKDLDLGEAEALVRSGEALAALEIPAQQSFFNLGARGGPIRLVVDGSEPLLIEPAIGRIEAIYWRGLTQDEFGVSTGRELEVERLYNPAARADWHFLPALAGVTVMISMLMLGALSLAREKEMGTWEGLLSLPLSRPVLILGKLAPYVVIGSVQGALVVLAGALIFELPLASSAWALILLMPIFAAAHLALGYAMAARAQSQLAALQGAVAFYLPAMLLSGFLYPFAALPAWAQKLGAVFPLTHFINASRGATIKGESIAEVAVSGWPVVVFLVAAAAAALLLQDRDLG